MNKRIAQNALNLLLNENCSFNGAQFGALLEVVRELQVIIGGPESDEESGVAETPFAETG